MTKEQNIHQGLMDYLMRYTAFSRWWFGFSRIKAAEASFIPIPGERYIEEWVEGGGYCEYQFAIGVYFSSPQQPYVSKKQTEGVDAAFDVQAFMAWIEAENNAGRLPQLGEGLVPEAIKVLQGVPTITGENESTTKILFAAAITYYEIKERKQ